MLPPNPALIFINGIMLSGKSTLAIDLKTLLEECRISNSQNYMYHQCVICDTGKESSQRLPASRSPLNESIKTIRENGGLQPILATASVLYSFFEEHLVQTKDIIISGSPRSTEEASLLIDFLKKVCDTPQFKRTFFSVLLTIPEDEFIKRLTTRSAEENRPDDLKMSAVRMRIQAHTSNTIPAVDRLNYGLQISDKHQMEIGSNEKTKYEVFNMIEKILF